MEEMSMLRLSAWIVAGLLALPGLAAADCAEDCLLHLGDQEPIRATLVDPKVGKTRDLGYVGAVQSVFDVPAGKVVVTSDGVYAVDVEGVRRMADPLPNGPYDGLVWRGGDAVQVAGYAWDDKGDLTCTLLDLNGSAWMPTIKAPLSACEPTRSYEEDLRSTACTGPGCAELDGPAYATLAGVLGVSAEEATLGLLQPAAVPYRLVFVYEFGDSAYIAGPVALQGMAGRVTPIAGARQVTLAQNDALVLVAEQYTGAEATVLDMTSGKTLWQSDSGITVWLH